MMSCQRYVFLLTSGKLEEAGLGENLWATQHRLSCRHCRAFTRNDRRLDQILQQRAERLQRPDAPDTTQS